MHSHLPDSIVRALAQRGGGASRQELHSWGLTRWDLERLVRDGELVRVARGCYRRPLALTEGNVWTRARDRHLREMAAVAGPDTVAGLRTAALVLGHPVSTIPRLPEVIRPPGSAPKSGTRTITSRLEPSSVITCGGIAVTGEVRTGVDVAIDLPQPEALMTLDAILRRRVPRSLLIEALAQRGPVRGCQRARQSIDWADGHAESPIESRGRGELMIRGVPRPQCNLTLRFQGVDVRPDDFWGSLGIAGEADGRPKYEELADETTLWSEKWRQEWMENELGLFVMRWIDREMRTDADSAAARWRRLAARRGGRPWVPPSGLERIRRPLPPRNESSAGF